MKNGIRISLISIAIFFSTNENAQAQTFQTQKKQITVYNLGTGFIVGGVGALINKRKGQNGWNVFLKGAAQGTLGGLVNYGSKNIVNLINKKENIAYGWFARISQSVGTSIIENAASNRNFWEAYHFSYGPLRFDIDAKRKFKPSIKVMPGALIGMIWLSNQGKLSIKYSLRSGAIVFISEDQVKLFGTPNRAYTMGNTIALQRSSKNDYELFAHEMAHVMQYNEFVGINSFINKPMEKWQRNSRFFNNLSKYVYFDFYSVALLGASQLLHNDSNYNQNWFEFEAEHFATKRFVRR